MSGEDVEKLQTRLMEIGYYAGTVDGVFGSLTHGAVMSYQAARKLIADGIVGQSTQEALGFSDQTTPASQPVTASGTGASKALSLHIGINSVDPSNYGGWNGALSGCENDAQTMTTIALAEGFIPTRLFTRQASTANVLSAIDAAAQQLSAGDIFLLTYAGHGGQVPNKSADSEEDQQDETWVLYDRQLIDDEIELALSAFRPGVNIVMLSDSCHSGTINRKMEDPLQLAFAELKRSFYTDIGLPRVGPGEGPLASFPRPIATTLGLLDRSVWEQRSLYARAIPLVGDGAVQASQASENPYVVRFPGQGSKRMADSLERGTTSEGGDADTTRGVETRELPLGFNVVANTAQAKALDAAKAVAQSRGPIAANGLLISGCLDSQLSQESNGNGVFTTTLMRTWANNRFAGSYLAFHKAIVSQMGPTQVPALSLFGGDPNTLAARTPFNNP
ncbi:caspase family protein [Streptomyces canus]|uniref:caspase family protein n=1 Tax=Streptomyces canus TaxID=58343 RepID=UPI0030DF09BB